MLRNWWKIPAISLYIQIFVYLQCLDLLTTLVGFRLGLSEASPFIRALMHAGPLAAILLSKLLALGIAGLCAIFHREFVIRKINYWYAALVVWNLSMMLIVKGNR